VFFQKVSQRTSLGLSLLDWSALLSWPAANWFSFALILDANIDVNFSLVETSVHVSVKQWDISLAVHHFRANGAHVLSLVRHLTPHQALYMVCRVLFDFDSLLKFFGIREISHELLFLVILEFYQGRAPDSEQTKFKLVWFEEVDCGFEERFLSVRILEQIESFISLLEVMSLIAKHDIQGQKS
jgi:hypothetical protein